MRALEDGHVWFLVAALAVVAFVVATTLWVRRRLVQSRMLRRFRIARAAEDGAAHLLHEHGYRVLGRRVPVRYPIWVDGVQTEIDLQLDYLVERDGRQFVAEVKSGAVAPSLAHAATRRQLIEYGIATGTSELLLVDAEHAAISVIRIERESAKRSGRGLALVGAYFFGALSGALVALWLRFG